MEESLNEFLLFPHKMELIQDKDEGGFVVTFPDLPGCISIGDTVEEAYENAKDAKRAWFDAAVEDNNFTCSQH